MGITSSATRWIWSFVLLLPVITLYLSAWFGHPPGERFTGFLIYDMGVYMADARSFFTGGFHFLYSNPSSADSNAPAIYFQPQFLLLGIVQVLTGADPGLIFVIFGFFTALIAIRVAIALYEEIAGSGGPWAQLGWLLFVWGGGVVILCGFFYHLISHHPPSDFMTDLLGFDPCYGWWFLNLGRNLILPTEAYYHALAFGAVLMALRGHYGGAVGLAFLLSISHPFTGVQFALILLAWCTLERFWVGNKELPWWFALGMLSVLVFHFGYYLWFLNRFAEHRNIFEQYSQSWGIRASSFVPADLLVGLLAYVAMRNLEIARRLFARPANRLLLIWFVVSFLLAHHDAFVDPRMPVHFTRGYTWIPLFLLGIQPLLGLIDRCFRLKGPLIRSLAITSVLMLGLSDNGVWLAHQCDVSLRALYVPDARGEGLYLRDSDRQLMGWLKERPLPHRELIVSPEYETLLTAHPVKYLSTVYTDYRASASHAVTTPFYARRTEEEIAYFQAGKVPDEWRGRSLLIVSKIANPPPGFLPDAPVVYENKDYRVQAMTMP